MPIQMSPRLSYQHLTVFLVTLTSVFITLSLMFVIALILAYLFSIASVGNTIIYTILRKRSDGENLLEVEEEEDAFPDNDGLQEKEATDGTSETPSDA